MKLLHVDSSILGPGSVSRQLSAEIVAAKQRLHSGLEVVYRDLAVEPVGHLSGAHLAAAQGTVPEAEPLRHDVAAGQAALEELLAADIVVVGAPMYNFAEPAQGLDRPAGGRRQDLPLHGKGR
jgi:FMN-dependent NADH-azoreductase